MSDMETSDVQDAAPPEVPAPAAVPVVAQAPSSASPTQAPEAAPVVDEPLSLEDAARVLILLVKAHRTAGDADVEAAIADVEAALPPAAA